MLSLDSPLLSLPYSLFCQPHSQNELGMSGKREKGLWVRRRDISSDRAELLRGWVTSASLWRCGDEVMGWWWHLRMEGWRQGARWRVYAYRLWPLGSETPLSWQCFIERTLKARGSTSDPTTISPLTKLAVVCLDKWSWQPPTMRCACRLTAPPGYRLVQPGARRQGSVCFTLLPTGVSVSMNVTIRETRANILANECVCKARINISIFTDKCKKSCCFHT